MISLIFNEYNKHIHTLKKKYIYEKNYLDK